MGDASDPQTRLPYAYCAGDPVYNSDPTGKGFWLFDLFKSIVRFGFRRQSKNKSSSSISARRKLSRSNRINSLIVLSKAMFACKPASSEIPLNTFVKGQSLPFINFALNKRSKKGAFGLLIGIRRSSREKEENEEDTSSALGSAIRFGLEVAINMLIGDEIVEPQEPKKAGWWDRNVWFKIPIVGGAFKAHRRGEYIQDIIAYEMYHSENYLVKDWLGQCLGMRKGGYDPNNINAVFKLILNS